MPGQVGPSSPSQVAVLSQSTTLTDAQIKSLPTTPVEIIPAQGEGKLICFLYGALLIDLTEGYLDGDAMTCEFDIGIYTVSAIYLESEQGAFASPGSALLVALPAQDASTVLNMAWNGELSSANQPLKVSMNNSAVNLSGGDAANSVRVIAVYTVLDI